MVKAVANTRISDMSSVTNGPRLKKSMKNNNTQDILFFVIPRKESTCISSKIYVTTIQYSSLFSCIAGPCPPTFRDHCSHLGKADNIGTCTYPGKRQHYCDGDPCNRRCTRSDLWECSNCYRVKVYFLAANTRRCEQSRKC